jgi:TonB-linked SusC/RagA family outer membrane protein
MKRTLLFSELYFSSLKKILLFMQFTGILIISGILKVNAIESDNPGYRNDLSLTQQAKISGTVTDASTGEALPGVNIMVEGTTVGAMTDSKGNFSLNAPSMNSVLVISFVGYQTERVTYTGQQRIDIKISSSVQALNEVVVTALGIKREAKSMGYAATAIDNQQIATARVTNIGNSLVGKVAGMNVTSPTSGPGGSSKIRIRGQSSFGANNSPLIIVDGVPFDNTSSGALSSEVSGGRSTDSGDGLQSLNPDDIESMTVLKGVAASALYGYRAKDGAIIITTKTGAGTKGFGVEFNSNTQISQALDYTDFQYEYGQGENGLRPKNVGDAQTSGVFSFGEKFDGAMTPQFDGSMQPYLPHKNRYDFYRKALSSTNSLAFTGGNENGNFRLSFANTDAEAIVPNSDFHKKILNAGVNYKITKKINVSLNINYSNEKNINPPNIASERVCIPATLSTLATSIDYRWLQNYIVPETGDEMPLARFTGRNNPYWTAYKQFENDKRDRLFGNLSIHYDITDWLYIMGRVGQDYYNRYQDYNRATGSRDLSSAPTGFNGNYGQGYNTLRELNMDFLIGAKHKFGDFGTNLTLGGNQMDRVSDNLSTYVENFYVRNLYTIGNGITKSPSYSYAHKKVNSLYGALELSYRSILFLNFTGRNDWFSTLNPESNSYLYPSASASFVFSDAIPGRPGWLDFGKLRVAYAEVGGDTDPYTNSLYYGISSTQLNGVGLGSISSSTSPNPNLKPLKVKEAEFGIELKTFHSRVNLDLSVYRKNTMDEILNVTVSQASGYTQTKVNIGKLRNNGVEALLTLVPVAREVTWETGFNGAYNGSKVLELAGGQTRFQVATGYWFGYIAHEVGKPLASVQAFDYKRDSQGRILSSAGKPLLGDLKTFGSGVPKWTGAWVNTITYKGFRIFTQVDFKAGFVLLSNSNFNAAREGLSKYSLSGREGGVIMDGYNADGTKNTTAVPAEEWYSSVRGLGEMFIFKGDFIKWRTLSIGYDLGRIIKAKVFKGITASVFVNNVMLIKKYLDNYDPDAQFAVSDNFQGLEVNTLPSTRNYGFNLNIKF